MSETNPIKIKGVVIPQHKTANDWNTSNYIPAVGEKIVYDADDTIAYTRVKHGDGQTPAKNLPFTIDPTVQDWARTNPPTTVDCLSVLNITETDTIEDCVNGLSPYTTRNIQFQVAVTLDGIEIPIGTVGIITRGVNEAILNLTDRNRNNYIGYWQTSGEESDSWKMEYPKAALLKNIQVSSINELEGLVLLNKFNKTCVLEFTSDISICVGTKTVNGQTILLFDTIPQGTVGVLTLSNDKDNNIIFKVLLNLTYPDCSTSIINTTTFSIVYGYLDENSTQSVQHIQWNTEQRGPTCLATHVVGDYNSLAAIPIKYGFYGTYGIAVNDKKPDGTAGNIVIEFPAFPETSGSNPDTIPLDCTWSQGIMVCDGDITLFLYDYGFNMTALYADVQGSPADPSKWRWLGMRSKPGELPERLGRQKP